MSVLENVLYVINDTNEIVSLCYAQSYFPLNTFNPTGNCFLLSIHIKLSSLFLIEHTYRIKLFPSVYKLYRLTLFTSVYKLSVRNRMSSLKRRITTIQKHQRAIPIYVVTSTCENTIKTSTIGFRRSSSVFTRYFSKKYVLLIRI